MYVTLNNLTDVASKSTENDYFPIIGSSYVLHKLRRFMQSINIFESVGTGNGNTEMLMTNDFILMPLISPVCESKVSRQFVFVALNSMLHYDDIKGNQTL